MKVQIIEEILNVERVGIKSKQQKSNHVVIDCDLGIIRVYNTGVDLSLIKDLKNFNETIDLIPRKWLNKSSKNRICSSTIDNNTEITKDGNKPIEPINVGNEGFFIGYDESGVGNYFGPLVMAVVKVNSTGENILKSFIKSDCKKTTINESNKIYEEINRASKISSDINYQILIVNNIDYNISIDKGYNKLDIMTEGCIKVISSIGTNDVNKIFIDKFLSDYPKDKVRIDKIVNNFKGIDIKMEHKLDEINIGCMAASHIARSVFEEELEKLRKKYGCNLTNSPTDRAVIPDRDAFISKYSKEELKKVAKYHFKTTDK